METNRDAMHAAGGDFITGQMQREGQSSVRMVEARQRTRSPRATLSMADDYKLCNWLHEREPKRGETPQDIFLEASAVLNIRLLNSDHIRTRLNELAATLPKAKGEPLTLEQRIERLESLGMLIARLRTSGDQANIAELAFLADFEASINNERA